MPPPDAVEHLLETLLVVRFQQIIERVNLERLQRELIVRSYEDNLGQRRRKGGGHLKTVQLGHLHVQKHDVRPQTFHRGQGLRAVAGFADHLEIRGGFEQPHHFAPRRTLVVNQQDFDRHEMESSPSLPGRRLWRCADSWNPFRRKAAPAVPRYSTDRCPCAAPPVAPRPGPARDREPPETRCRCRDARSPLHPPAMKPDRRRGESSFRPAAEAAVEAPARRASPRPPPRGNSADLQNAPSWSRRTAAEIRSRARASPLAPPLVPGSSAADRSAARS